MKLFDVYPLFDIEIKSGKGCYTYDTEGNEYLDLYGGHAVRCWNAAQVYAGSEKVNTPSAEAPSTEQ